ncbi:hypothetical protein E4U16_002414 [Claviceps sp. LM84 group G4]|nr:hypothetical protein E4U16_002414 [Claviceps sp. LM84 group G4]
MHENEANQQDQRLLELRETKKMLLLQLQEKDQQLQEMNQQIQDYYQSQQSTTFCEYIEGCHETLCYELADQPNGRLETNGSTTSTYSTACPVELREWVGFLDEQKLLFDEICDAFPPEHRAFLSPRSQELLRKDFNSRRHDVERFIHYSIERPVMIILKNLQSLDGIDKGLRFGGNLVFDDRSSHHTSDL